MSTQVLAPLPTYNQVKPEAVTLSNYYVLYNHYFFGSALPAGFPSSIVSQFPNRSYKRQLKAAIQLQTSKVNGMYAIHNEYLSDYYALYMHYSYSTALPVDFPAQILSQFPSSNYKQTLKAAIAQLQDDINGEKG